MAIEISKLAKEDIPCSVEIVQKAFEDDPYFLWVFDAQKFSKERNAASITARCLWGINNGLFYVAKEVPSTNGDGATSVGPPKKNASRIVGVAMWLPPHPLSEPESWYSYFQSWILTFRQAANNILFRGHGGLNIKRYWIWKDAQNAVQSEIWNDSRGYYFCNVIAVADDARGKGIGKKLVEIVTDKADQEGMKCYLESSKKVPNLEIYGRMGFKFAKEMECHDGEDVCKLYCMTREPKYPSKTTPFKG
ncbi:acetyltransferase [Histoplasma capsulatum H143]|uniref:Acetyltransferase n=1 Tax=Ajellomyces capsulatus (strain H143) TaxID=544712 RepID=C6HQF8_AJECH|nr:acetyltransferase [Histoplasma capsulatum H143]